MVIDNAGTTVATIGGALQLDYIPVVDLRLLSQSEIYALSLCSSSSFDPDRDDDVVIPKIDRSVFNESAGSRKQTYSRLRLAPPSTSPSGILRRRIHHLRRSSASIVNCDNNDSDPENGENAQMLPMFTKLFVSDINLGESFPIKVDNSDSLFSHQLPLPSDQVPVECLSGHKRKHEHIDVNEKLPDKTHSAMGNSVVGVNDNVDEFSSLHEVVVRENLDERDKGILNRDGVAVDIVALGLADHPYWEEISRRTEGLETMEELQGLLGGLKGRWGSSRKKKRTVDASEFGSALPIGWKLLLSVEKKKNGCVWLCCACYISPSGRQFVSCKEASSYLITLTGIQDTHPSTYEIVDDKLISIRNEDTRDVENPSVPAFISATSNHVIQVASDAGISPNELLDEILSCDKCNVTLCKKDEFLHNRSSIHRSNGYRNIVRITKGELVNDYVSFNRASNFSGEIHARVTENSTFIEKPKQNLESECSLEQFPRKIVELSISASMESDINCNNMGEIASSCDANAVAVENVPCSEGNDVSPRKKMELVEEFEGVKIDSFISNQIHLEQERLFGIECDGSSFNNTTHELESSFNMFCEGMDSNIRKSMLNSGPNFVVGYGGSNAQSGDFIRDDGCMRTGHENLFRGCFDPVPNPNVETSSRFRTFDQTSEKEAASKNLVRPGRNEYSLMGGQSSSSLSGRSNIFSQHSFWLDNDALVPTNTSVCVWCQTLFYQEEVQTQTAGTIGSLCSSCSTRISGHY